MDIDIDLDWQRGKSPQAFAKRMALFKTRLGRELEKAMQDAVLWVERDAKQFAPFDRGTKSACDVAITWPTAMKTPKRSSASTTRIR